MIKVFSAADTSFSTNGDIVLKPLRAKVHKEDNGDFYLDLAAGLEYVDYFYLYCSLFGVSPTGILPAAPADDPHT